MDTLRVVTEDAEWLPEEFRLDVVPLRDAETELRDSDETGGLVLADVDPD